MAYAPKVVTIWEGFKEYFVATGLPFDYILYSNYERQVEAQFAGQIHVAWNSPLAWVRAERLAAQRGVAGEVRAIAMRDTDCDLTSVIVVRGRFAASAASGRSAGASVCGVGAIDSPQATLIPLQLAARARHQAGSRLRRCGATTCWAANTATISAASATRRARCWPAERSTRPA